MDLNVVPRLRVCGALPTFPTCFRGLVLEHSDKLYGPVVFYEEEIKYSKYVTYVLILLLALNATGNVPSHEASCNHEQWPARYSASSRCALSDMRLHCHALEDTKAETYSHSALGHTYFITFPTY